MKIYTRTGDQGQTSLYGGSRVNKTDHRIQAIGQIDLLNAELGWLIAHYRIEKPEARIIDQLTQIQSHLFIIGSCLASLDPKAPPLKIQLIDNQVIEELEQEIDRLSEFLEPLTNFILPGGSLLSAQTQVLRSQSRIAETMSWQTELNIKYPEASRYLNRLSDFFFVLARYFNYRAKVEEPLWEPRT
ncbi:MAG: ATP/cobalamin adenosyltransferase [Candidatus Berkelbacteria bacterium Gr01-1014_85]|uniref:Corrinoid adenosyltransferase n=1 Tax=Candidatus Berkelbacteria bacterium Gr01-1014_85 TaxID=2017150 RepID=A0A554JE65_9BACT|nr:MAG: ATP/cobalamin adenosyltransferase [Candidatus Berkelbacteria bacterium Gr01-1014_85]